MIRPRQPSGAQRQLLSEAREKGGEAGFFLKTLVTRSVRVINGSGRRMNVLAPEDASYLYRRLHSAPTLVLSVGSVLMSTDPSRDPPNRRASRLLEDFIAYKAVHGLVRGRDDIDAHFRQFESWRKTVNCEGASDPRALPLHVFDTGSAAIDLSTSLGIAQFRSRFGPAQSRSDEASRRWERRVDHGRDALSVAGCELPAGTHWDVSSERGGFRLMNAVEVWEVKARAYLNVYPDEHIRGPRRNMQGRARRLWPKKNAPH